MLSLSFSILQALFISLFAGIATVLISGIVAPQSYYFSFFSLLAPLPLLIAGMNWHPLLAALGGIIAAIIGGQLIDNNAMILIALVYALPAYIISMFYYGYFHEVGNHLPQYIISSGELRTLGMVVVMLAFYIATINIMILFYFESAKETLISELSQFLESELPKEKMTKFLSDLFKGDVPVIPWDKFYRLLSVFLLVSSVIALFISHLISFMSYIIITEWNRGVKSTLNNFSDFKLPNVMSFFFLFSIFIAFVAWDNYVGFFGLELASLFIICFILQGLAVFHQRTAHVKGRGIFLTLFWLLTLLLGFPIFLFVFIGILDQFFDFRRKKAS